MSVNSENAIELAAGIIGGGGLVAFPTETVYGLGADALNPEAVAKIFSAKQRPKFDPLIVHIADSSEADRLAEDIPGKARELMQKFWPGPLTLILPKKSIIPEIVTSGLPDVALRVPDNKIALNLIKNAGTPIAAPSANKFGRISPTTPEHVREQFGKKIDMILDGGPCRIGVESTIIKFTDDVPFLLRPGGISLEKIASITGEVNIPSKYSMRNVSPGRQMRHYAPATPLIPESEADHAEWGRMGYLSYGPLKASSDIKYEAVEVLSEKEDLEEAASRLFAAMRRLDAMNLDVIITSPMPEYGLGMAINDRISRAFRSDSGKDDE